MSTWGERQPRRAPHRGPALRAHACRALTLVGPLRDVHAQTHASTLLHAHAHGHTHTGSHRPPRRRSLAAAPHRSEDHILEMDQGHCTIRPGSVRHGGHPVSAGDRYILGAFLLIADRVEHVRRLNSQGREARGRGDLRGTCPLSSVPVPTSMRARQDTLLHVLCFLSRSSDLILPFACIRRVTLPADGTHAHLLTPSRPPLSSPSHQHPTLQPRASSSSGRSSSTPSAPPALRTGARR